MAITILILAILCLCVFCVASKDFFNDENNLR